MSLVLVPVNVIFDVVEDAVIVVLLSDIPSEELLEAVPPGAKPIVGAPARPGPMLLMMVPVLVLSK